MLEQTPAHHLPVRHPPKRLWQKITLVIANLSFLCAAIGIVVTLIYGSSVEAEYKAAMGAITFFSFAVGVVCKALGGTSIPSLKLEPQNKKPE